MVCEIDVARVALLLAQQNGWNKVKIQVDIKALAESLQVGTIPVQEAIIIAEDICCLKLMFEPYKFSFFI